MVERPLYVVDASIIVRRYLNSPPHVDLARQVREDYLANRIAVLAAENLRAEVGGAIHQAVVSRSIRAPDGETRYRSFLNLGISTVETENLYLPAYRLSIRLGCSFYDAIYLALGEARNVSIIHADNRLRHALGTRFPLERWIEDYRSPI